MKKSYVISKDCRVPSVIVVQSRIRGKQTEVKYKVFRRGDLVNGELKHNNNEPAFVLADNYVIPLSCVKEIVTKEIISGASGETTPTSQAEADTAIKKVVVETNPKIKYMDAGIIGLGIGVAALIGIKKYTGWLSHASLQPNDKKLLQVGIVAVPVLMAMYIVYRNKNSKKVEVKPKSE